MAACDLANMHEPLATPRDAIRAMIAAEAEAGSVTLAELLSPCRRRMVVRARHQAIRRVHAAFPAKSFPELGRIFRRDHTSVMYALGRLKRGPRP